MGAADDIIDIGRVLSLRPPNACARLHPDEELLPLPPGMLLPHLGAPLIEVQGGLGPWVQPCLRAAASVDSPLVVGVEGDPGKGARGGLHGAVGEVLESARAARYRRPLVIHARLGTSDAEDAEQADAMRVRTLEALDAGVTSVQLGASGEPDVVVELLVEVLQPVVDRGLGVVIQVVNPEQAVALPLLLKGRVDVDAWTGHAVADPLARREAFAKGARARWLDATPVLGGVIRAVLKDHEALGSVALLHGLFAHADDPVRDRLEARVFSEVEDVLGSVRAGGSAGRAMVALSAVEADMPFEKE